MLVDRRCACCGTAFTAKSADVKRGWGKFCSKSCKAKKQEARTGQYSAYKDDVERRAEEGYDADQDAAGHPFASGYFGTGQE